MAIFAVIMPIVMLCVVLALGRYEELLLPPLKEASDLDEHVEGVGADGPLGG
ncbi:hypothetical protein [Streptomyces sp. GC420]|uniref:hypothetical protein n=1 Tax=Streptomyces sp. GC420 TaxID=2697568 RepID=UPI001414DACD|nr:hypothetical protein [Streptomyces sp. GC420]